MTVRTASCSCGQLRLTVSEDPLRVSICHCLDCQRRTGSAFGAQARFRSEGIVIAGESATYLRVGDEGRRSRFHFCPVCGATVYFVAERRAGQVGVPVGAFADPEFPAPSFSFFEARMHAWVGLPANIEHLT